jgi:Holliday junction resolvase RusA-like endonuclease
VPASHPVHAWRLAVARAARRAFADLGALGIAFDGVVRIDALIVLPRPSTLLRRADTDDLLWAPKRPDRDNIVKALQDALVVGVLDEAGRCVSRGVLSDDSCVVCGEALKTYAERGEQPRVELLLSVEQRSPRQVWDELCAGVSSRLGVAIPTQRSRRSTDPRQPPTPSTQTALGI